jgi:hypothetical protein
MFVLSYKTSYLNKEVNRTEPSPSVRVPWLGHPSGDPNKLLGQDGAKLCARERTLVGGATNKLECCITLGRNGLPGRNTPAYWSHS